MYFVPCWALIREPRYSEPSTNARDHFWTLWRPDFKISFPLFCQVTFFFSSIKKSARYRVAIALTPAVENKRGVRAKSIGISDELAMKRMNQLKPLSLIRDLSNAGSNRHQGAAGVTTDPELQRTEGISVLSAPLTQ